MNSKLPRDKSVEDLLNDLNRSDIEDIKEYEEYSSDDVLQFIAYFGLQNGTEKVRAKVLYKLYRRWSRCPVTTRYFNDRLRDVLTHEMHANVTDYLINRTALQVSDALIDELRRSKRTRKYKRLRTKVPRAHKEFKKFCTAAGIKRGGFFIEVGALFFIYDGYKYARGERGLSFKNFVLFCKHYFEWKILTPDKMPWIGIQKETVKGDYMSDERLKSIKAWSNKYYGKNKTSYPQSKKEGQIPGPRSKVQPKD